MAKTKKLVYARDCKQAGELISELIHKCNAKSTKQSFDWKTGKKTEEKIIGCHSQTDCIFFKQK